MTDHSISPGQISPGQISPGQISPAKAPETGEQRGATNTRRRSVARTVGIAAAGLAALAATGAGSAAWAVTQFNDVPPQHRFYDEINWAAEHHITEGYSDGSFRPTDPVTRQAAAAFISRYNASIETTTFNFAKGAGFSVQMTADCPAGKRPIGGGGSINQSGFNMTDSKPAPNGWTGASPRGGGGGRPR